MGTEMRTKGFGVDGANDTFCHKEYSHVLGEHIAQKGMHMTAHVWTHMLLCSFGWCSCHLLSHYAKANVGFTQPNLVQWSCTRPFQHNKSTRAITCLNSILWG